MKTIYVILLVIVAIYFSACNSASRKPNENFPIDQHTLWSDSSLEQKRDRNDELQLTELENSGSNLANRSKVGQFYNDENGNVIYYNAEIQPAFVGGDNALDNYLRDNLRYPVDAELNEIEETLFVDFIISSNGSVRNIVITEMPGKKIDKRLRNEAIRVITNMPKWTPGLQNGKAVNVAWGLPITF
jgi:Gram-negative bacterial TonB protein C-terminal